MEKILDDKQILEKILEELNLKVPTFSKKLGYANNMTVYNVFQDKVKQLSEDMQSRIIANFPEVNPLFLKYGQGDVINLNRSGSLRSLALMSPKIVHIENMSKNNAADIEEIKQKLARIEDRLDDFVKMWQMVNRSAINATRYQNSDPENNKL